MTTLYKPATGLIQARPKTRYNLPGGPKIFNLSLFQQGTGLGLDGPETAINYSGNFISGIVFTALQTPLWCNGIYWWVCPDGGQPTGPTKIALWNVAATGNGQATATVLIGSASVASQQVGWNFAELSAPVQLAIGGVYIAAVGINGPFADTGNQFGTGDPYGLGITNGALFGFSGQSALQTWPRGPNPPHINSSPCNGVFTTAGDDPTVTCPPGGDSTYDNFWVDILVTNETPSAYSGSYRLWPNREDAGGYVGGDTATTYNLAVEIWIDKPVTVDNFWFFSVAGSTGGLPTDIGIWNVTTQKLVPNSHINSPVWHGAEGSGWVRSNMAPLGITLPPGKYRPSAYNSNGASGSWNATSPTSWGNDANSGPDNLPQNETDFPNGITWGPLYAPPSTIATPSNIYGDLSQQLSGQAIFADTDAAFVYPNEYVTYGIPLGNTNFSQNYWIDLEVTPT